ncbi:iron chaperone [Paramicrobacterium chengjingii]|uniref:iron chaperone n=1 Tax=Paramicrobacterium chengjingii TaxID=2769067 RepID=UPI00141E2195|nr:DUF1801 domain-containing protein [Microbacterium chengjingii]
MGAQAKPRNVDEYISQFDDAKAGLLGQLRALCHEAAPNASEQLKWGSPSYSLDRILFVFSGHAKHANMTFTPSTRAAFDAELADFETGKGSVKLPYEAGVPRELLLRMMQYRVIELTRDNVNWM